ncbi:MAG: DUF4859 domain-containing protein [Bacteroidaceae bacterium]|nr:DUF4859 domain-containing protein [Bacteroidaceae bacterium]
MAKTYFRSLMASLFLLVGMSASAADFIGKTVQQPASNYDTQPVVFSLKEVAAKANLTADELVAKLDAWAATFITSQGDDNFTTPNPMMFVEDQSTTPATLYSKYTQGSAGGFWLNRNGLPVAWGDDAMFYNTLRWSTAENDSLVFEIGQYPGHLLTGGDFTTHYVLSIDGGLYEISFDINLVVESDFVPLDPHYSKLTIVGELEQTFEQYPVDGYEPFEFDITDLIEKLGCTADYLQSNLQASLYVAQLDNSEESLMPTARGDSLTNQSSAKAIGWWWNTCTDEEGNPSNECVRGSWGPSKYYSEQYALNITEEGRVTITGIIGQSGTSLSPGDSFYNYVYVIFSDKAIALKFNLNIIEDEENPVVPSKPIDLTKMEKVGSQELTFEEYKSATDQQTVNLAAVAELMGESWTADTLILAALYDETGDSLTIKSTANNRGYHMNTKGVVVSWSGDGSTGNALWIEPALADGEVTLTSGNTSSNVNEEETYTFPMFYISPDTTKYYQLDISVTIKVHQDINPDEFTEVGVWNIEVECLTADTSLDPDGYAIREEPELDLAALEELIETRDPAFYGWSIPDEEGNSHPEDTYSMHCDPAPGWWFNADGYVSGWGSNSMVGVCLLPNGHLDLYRMPGVPKNGDVWNGNLMLLNEATNKYITVNLTVSFFDTLIQVETVGEEEINLLAGDEDQNQIDIAPMLEALNITADALVNGPISMGYLPNGKWSNVSMCDAGLIFKDGKVNEGADFNSEPEKCDFLVGFYSPDVNSTISTFYADRSNAFDFSGTYKCDLAVTANDKAYIYHITIYDDEAWVGVNSLKADTKHTGTIFNLAGQRVSKATKGVYIMNGKKVAVK